MQQHYYEEDEEEKSKVEDMRIDYIGLNSLHLGLADTSLEVVNNLNEVVLRIHRTLEKEEPIKLFQK